MQKSEIRRLIRQRRRSLSRRNRALANVGLKRSFLKHSRVQFGTRIALYLTNDGEISTSATIEALIARGKQIYLPVLHPLKSGHLVFLRYKPGVTQMRKNRFGIAEPDFGAGKRLAPRFISAIGMPLVAFDLQGNRLGMGGGFYDRTLERKNAAEPEPCLIGCAYECQKIEVLPAEPWDISLSAVATEERLRFF